MFKEDSGLQDKDVSHKYYKMLSTHGRSGVRPYFTHNITFICKTDINTDGRVLNQMDILIENLPNTEINLILLPDKDVRELNKCIRVFPIKCRIRNSDLFKVFTIGEWTIKALWLLFKLRPTVLHAQDSESVLPVLLYKLLGGKAYIIYDDHELPNENDPLYKRVWNRLEISLIKRANTVIFANRERLDYVKSTHGLKNDLIYFLNLPYNSSKTPSILPNSHQYEKLQDIDNEVQGGSYFIMHQGPLRTERGRKQIAELSKRLPEPYKILLVGGSINDFNSFCEEFNVNAAKFYFVGTVPYSSLPYYWEKVVASIVIYLPTYINNRLCAPNRLYLSYFLNVPLIVNRNNPVLKKFIEEFNAGFFIEEIDTNNLSTLFRKWQQNNELNARFQKAQLLINDEVAKILKLYRKALGLSTSS